MARLIFVNRFFWPDETATGQLLTDLAGALAARGHDVTVIASRPETRSTGHSPPPPAVRLLHVGSSRVQRGGLPGKALDYATFFVGALWRLFRQARRGDVVIALTDPPLLGLGAALVAATRGARLVHWVQDIYPELAIELAGQSWLRLVRPWRDAVWRRAAHCVTLGNDMAATLARAGVPADRATIIPNWAPAGTAIPDASAVAAQRRAWGLTGKLVVGYSGNLGRVHDLDPVLDLAAALRSHPAIVFLFVGGGAQRRRLEAAAVQRGLSNVTFQPPQPRAQLAAALGAADIHLVTLRPGCERLVFPSKLYGIAAIGRPIVFLGPTRCEIARLVTERGMGIAGRRDELPALATALIRLASDPVERAALATAALRFATDHAAESALRRWCELLERVAGSRPAAASVIASLQT